MNTGRKLILISLGIVAAIGIILGLMWYYQQQGLFKIFPSAEDKRIQKILKIDESRFARAEGLSDEQYQVELRDLYTRRDRAESNPNDSDAWFKYGNALKFFNDHQKAAEAWEEAFRLQPGSFLTALNLANNYQYFLKDFQKAQEYYLRALALKPDYTSAYEGLMDLYRYNLKEQIEHFEPLVLLAIGQDTQNKAYYYEQLTDFFASRKEWDRAKQYLTEVKKFNSSSYNDLVSTYPDLLK